MYEAMQLGRVPVVIADQWVAPEGSAWSRFIVRIAESRLNEIPSILRERECDYREMGLAARLAWEEWFSPETRLVHALEAIEDICLTKHAAHDESDCKRQWTTFGFEWRNGISVPQSAYWLAKNGMLAKRGSDHIRLRLAEISGPPRSKPSAINVERV